MYDTLMTDAQGAQVIRLIADGFGERKYDFDTDAVFLRKLGGDEYAKVCPDGRVVRAASFLIVRNK